MVEFAYAVGRVRALEVHLLDESRIIRMTEAKDFESAYLVLQESSFFADKIDQLPHPFDFDALLELELNTTRQILTDLAPGNHWLDLLWKKYEPGMTLNAYLQLLENAIKDCPSRILISYACGFIILNQLKIELMKGKFDPETVIARFRYTDYHRAVSQGMESFKKTGSLFALEREIDNQLTETVKNAKYKAFGLEPLVGFMVAREIEIKIIRLILTCKQLGIRTDEIKERMRLSYV